MGNRADGGAGGVRYGTNYNCIVYSNTAPSGVNFTGGRYLYSCTYPLPTGTGNITNKPGFARFGTGYGLAHGGGDYRLAPRSPCIETGTNLAWAASARDLAGRQRKMGRFVDMGAYEFMTIRGTVFTIR